jgi:hypothetical protein
VWFYESNSYCLPEAKNRECRRCAVLLLCKHPDKTSRDERVIGWKQKTVESGVARHHFLVLVSNGGNLFRHGKDNVEVLGIEKLRLTILDPRDTGQGLAFWTMPVAAAVVNNALEPTLITLFDMAAEGGGATAFDGAHDAELGARQGAGMLLAISIAIATKNVPDFQLGVTSHAPRSRLLGRSWFGLDGNRTREQIQRAGGRAHPAGRDAQIAGGSRQATVAEQQLDGAWVAKS